MRLPGGFASGRLALTRLRLAAVLVTGVLLALGVAAGASASRIQVKPSHGTAVPYSGHDWVGKVTADWSDIERDRRTTFGLYYFTFANLCSKKGSALKESSGITVGKDKRFHYHGHGFTVTGNVIGKLAAPKEIVGLASVSRGGCRSGPWWFEVKPS